MPPRAALGHLGRLAQIPLYGEAQPREVALRYRGQCPEVFPHERLHEIVRRPRLVRLGGARRVGHDPPVQKVVHTRPAQRDALGRLGGSLDGAQQVHPGQPHRAPRRLPPHFQPPIDGVETSIEYVRRQRELHLADPVGGEGPGQRRPAGERRDPHPQRRREVQLVLSHQSVLQ